MPETFAYYGSGCVHAVGIGEFWRKIELSGDAGYIKRSITSGMLGNVVRCGTSVNPREPRYEGLGEGGDDRLNEQACNRPCSYPEECNRSGPYACGQCNRSDD